jgi:hypothetical protein
MPSVTSMDLIRWWYNHRAHFVSSSTTLAFLNNIREKCKPATPSAIQVKNQWTTISIEEELHVVSQLEKGQRTVDICHGVRLAHSSMHKIRDNADTITKSAKSGTKVCSKTTTVLSEWTIPKLWMWVSYIFIALEINKYIVLKCAYILYKHTHTHAHAHTHTHIHTLYIQYVYTLQVHMSTSGIVIHHIGWGSPSPKPQEIHCFKWEFCVWFARFSGM